MAMDTAMARYYADRAPEYDAIYSKPERQPDLEQLRSHLRQLTGGRSVYEIASGTGYWTEVIASSVSQIFAVDCNPEVQALAAQRPTAGRKAHLALGDAFAPPVPPFSCDIGLAAFWWSHLRHAEKPRFLSAFINRLSPGATLIILDNHYVDGSSTPISRRDEEGNTYQSRPAANGGKYEVLKNFPSEEEIRRDLASVAQEVTWYSLRHYWLAVARLTS